MTTLAIDIGNTLTKFAVFQNDEMLSFQSLERFEKKHIRAILEQFSLDGYIVSSVAKTPDFMHELLKGVKHVNFDHQTPIPIINMYETPETLGLDRLALAVAAVKLAPQTDALVISAGTCITYDFITSKSEYRGGAISPGLRMRARALHEYTERLPLVDLSIDIDYCGTNSTSAIQSGILKGTQDEMEAKILFFKEKNPTGKVFFTGGDQKYLVNSTKNRIFADYNISNMVLIGLNEILHYNIK
ncbi:MAG: type III pantothenate kinase [Bacteroidales bacterium]|jgi:type III pantothenate kinase|nr:type III pantothenate kinase [Bacteroidales bacterium]